jgi:hypothetical protein
MKQNETKLNAKCANKLECIKCNFRCFKQSEWERHILTRKHKSEPNETKENPLTYACCCGQILQSRSTIWRHKKSCQDKHTQETDKKESTLTHDDIIKMLIKENSEFKNLILEVVKTVQPNNTTNNTNNTNSHNTTNNFNLQFFLNDTCKDAINLVDFVKSLQVQLTDLEETARLGYTEGVSKIFINGLNKLDVTMRPIHCSDAKRETLYIKDQDEWTKEDTDRTHLTKAIKTVTNKNIQQIFEWQKKYPEYKDPESKQSDRYMEMICNTMSGSSSEEQEKNINKIVKNITKEVVIDKTVN